MYDVWLLMAYGQMLMAPFQTIATIQLVASMF